MLFTETAADHAMATITAFLEEKQTTQSTMAKSGKLTGNEDADAQGGPEQNSQIQLMGGSDEDEDDNNLLRTPFCPRRISDS